MKKEISGLSKNDLSSIEVLLAQISLGDQSILKGALFNLSSHDAMPHLSTIDGSDNFKLWSLFETFGWMERIPFPEEIAIPNFNPAIFKLTKFGHDQLGKLLTNYISEGRGLQSSNLDPELYPADVTEFTNFEIKLAEEELREKYPESWEYFHKYGLVKGGPEDEKDVAWRGISKVVCALDRVRFNARNIAGMITAVVKTIYKG